MSQDPQARLEAALPHAIRRIQETPGVLGILWCGSASRGEAQDGSDLDFHVLVKGDRRWRRNFVLDGVPVEVFHNPARELRRRFANDDGDTLQMFAEGKVVLSHPELHELILEAQQRVKAGVSPRPITEFERLAVLEGVMDTRAQVSAPIHVALVMTFLVRHVVRLLYRTRGWWEVQEKHWLRDLETRAPDIAADLRLALTTHNPHERQSAFEALALRLTGDFVYRDVEGERQPVL